MNATRKALIIFDCVVRNPGQIVLVVSSDIQFQMIREGQRKGKSNRADEVFVDSFFALAKSLTLERDVSYKSHFDQVLDVRPGGLTRARYLTAEWVTAIKRHRLSEATNWRFCDYFTTRGDYKALEWWLQVLRRWNGQLY